MTHSCQYGWIGNFIPIQMQDGNNCTVMYWIEKFVGVPTGRKRASLALAIAYHCQGDELWMIEDGAERMCNAVPEFTALVYRL